LKYEGYLKLIYRFFSNSMYTQLIYIRIPYGAIICVYGFGQIIFKESIIIVLRIDII
jgi:hypothetical protein